MIHEESFCDFGQAITVTKQGDSIALHYVEYILPDWDGRQKEMRKKDGTHYIVKENCVKVKEVLKKLNKENWQGLEQKLNEADYWALNTRNTRSGFDGSDWIIYGYIKEPEPWWYKKKIHMVVRWSPENSFMVLGKYFLELSGQTTLCDEMR